MRNCGKCHIHGTPLKTVLDGKEWCASCQTYHRYHSHGWAVSRASTPGERAGECPAVALRDRAAAALDATHNVGERGPRTYYARQFVARWLDDDHVGRGIHLARARTAVAWLEQVAAQGRGR